MERPQERKRPVALVTGASAGIGERFAHELARRGHDLVLVARRVDRLEALASALARQHGVDAQALPADLANPADLESLESRISSLPLALLVNNAGFGIGRSFLEIDAAAHETMIRVHVLAAVRLTRAVLPGMIERRRGAVVNVSSLAGLLPQSSSSTTYGATKCYLAFFSQALDAELRGTGVRVQALCPGLTQTEFHQRARIDTARMPAWLWMSADAVVAASLAGLERRGAVCIPGLRNRLLVALCRLLPSSLIGAAVRSKDREAAPGPTA